MAAPFTFTLPPELSAKQPPERRGIRRDQVRLLVIERATGKIEHTRFDKIDNYLRQNDLLVFNSSRTLSPLNLIPQCPVLGPEIEARLRGAVRGFDFTHPLSGPIQREHPRAAARQREFRRYPVHLRRPRTPLIADGGAGFGEGVCDEGSDVHGGFDDGL